MRERGCFANEGLFFYSLSPSLFSLRMPLVMLQMSSPSLDPRERNMLKTYKCCSNLTPTPYR